MLVVESSLVHYVIGDSRFSSALQLEQFDLYNMCMSNHNEISGCGLLVFFTFTSVVLKITMEECLKSNGGCVWGEGGGRSGSQKCNYGGRGVYDSF